jgi:large subunit ribosomal protein L25
MRKDITLVADDRVERGKSAAKKLRTEGRTPATVYGPGKDPVTVAVSPKEINKILHSSSGRNTIFNLDLPGKETIPVMVIDWQHDPVRGSLLHVDLKRIDLSRKMRAKVPVITNGEPRGVKVQGGQHDIINREVEIECLPDDIPEKFTVEVGEMLIGQGVRAGDLPLKASMRLVSAADLLISHVIGKKAEEAPAEGEKAAEPEVIKKGKKEEAAPEGGDKKKR